MLSCFVIVGLPSKCVRRCHDRLRFWVVIYIFNQIAVLKDIVEIKDVRLEEVPTTLNRVVL